ncbi:hypothetical protein QTP88_018921 [Uroleucon formosanum]
MVPQGHNDKKVKRTKSSRIYHVLPKNTWTPLLAEHFWEHTQVTLLSLFSYIKIFGKCTICDSYFEDIVYKRPLATERVLLECSTQIALTKCIRHRNVT